MVSPFTVKFCGGTRPKPPPPFSERIAFYFTVFCTPMQAAPACVRPCKRPKRCAAGPAENQKPEKTPPLPRAWRGRHPKPGKIPRGGEKWDNSACFRRRAPVWGSLVRRAQNSGENRPHSPLQGVEKMIEFIQCSLDAGPVCQAYPNNP